MANCRDCGSPWDGKQTAPVCGWQDGDRNRPAGCTFAANRFGLYDMVGNVLEWTEDCWNDNYEGAPANGSPRTSSDCSSHVVRGGSWDDGPASLRSAVRGGGNTVIRLYSLGFRVARTLTP